MAALEQITFNQWTSIAGAPRVISDRPPDPSGKKPTTHHIFREGPHHSPPPDAEKCARTANWKVLVEFQDRREREGESSLDVVSGTYTAEVQAGTNTYKSKDLESIRNQPGWETLRAAMERWDWKNPDHDPDKSWEPEYYLEPSGGAYATLTEFVVEGVLVDPDDEGNYAPRGHVMVVFRAGPWVPAWRESQSGPPEEGWLWEVSCRVEAAITAPSDQSAVGDGGRLVILDQVETSLFTYGEEKGGTEQPTDFGIHDDSFKVIISHGSFFSSIE